MDPEDVQTFANPGPLLPTTAEVDTGRLNLSQELSLPFGAGPVKLAPYARLDLTWYSNDLFGEDNGRIYGGGGVRASMPLSKIYADASSDLLNVKGLHHKIVLGGNYYIADTSDGFDFNTAEPFGPTPYTALPQLDRLNDDATDQSVRDIRPSIPGLYPNLGTPFLTLPQFNPQFYAIRRLVDDRVDTLDEIQVIQLEARQRLQTKRGYPGLEHTVDWMRLDFSMSLFPDEQRDNFGETVAFVEYDSAWNVGDQTALFSRGWFDPFETGVRFFSAGVTFSRQNLSGPGQDTFLNLSYRHLDPLESRAVSASLTYRFSPKYSVTGFTTYDFGIQEALSNSLVLTRNGTDVQLSVGFSYDAIIENFGFTFEVVPNIVAATRGQRFQARSQVFGAR